MSNEAKNAQPKTREERRADARRIFDQLNKPGTITRALVDLHRVGGPSEHSAAEIRARYPAIAAVTDRMRRIGARINADEKKK